HRNLLNHFSVLLRAMDTNPNAGRSFLLPACLNVNPTRLLTFAAGLWGRPAEIALQRAYLEVVPKIGFYALCRSYGSGKSGVVRHFMQVGVPPQMTTIRQVSGSLGGVEYKLNPAIFDGVHNVGTALCHLVNLCGLDAVLVEVTLGAGRCDHLKAELS